MHLASELADALVQNRHLRSERVLVRDDGSPVSQQTIRTFVARVERVAGLRPLGVHALRHTFCSHLAMRGVPARTVMELAGHANLTTTMGYMHLSPRALEAGIRSLESGFCGDLGETAERAETK
jgi:site-specific recombinase XerD